MFEKAHLLSIIVSLSFLYSCATGKDLQLIHSDLDHLQRSVAQMEVNLDASLKKSQFASQEQLDAVQRMQAELYSQFQDLIAQLRAINAELEQTSYKFNQISQQVGALGASLNTSSLPDKNNKSDKKEAPTTVVEPDQVYKTAYLDYTKGNYNLALTGFKDYLAQYPQTELSDDALYWIGECYYSLEMYKRAIEEFENLLRRFPDGDKNSSSMLKKAFALEKLGNTVEALKVFKSVTQEYPYTQEAQVAKNKISQPQEQQQKPSSP